MDISAALAIFGFEKVPGLGDLKSKYRELCRKYHPDAGGTHDGFIALQNAYDYLSLMADSGENWQKEQERSLPLWKKKFAEGWRKAYENSRSQKPDDGLHFNTFISTFTRWYIYPPAEWFYQVLFGKKPHAEAMELYRSHLHRIAPNPKLKESYAKRYWELEFFQSWVFYLPPTLELLRSAK